MGLHEKSAKLDQIKKKYPGKLVSEERIFGSIRRGDRIFVGTGCGRPQYLLRALVQFITSHPTAIFDAEVFHVWTLGLIPYTDEKFIQHFRHNSFFIATADMRAAVNTGTADYTPT